MLVLLAGCVGEATRDLGEDLALAKSHKLYEPKVRGQLSFDDSSDEPAMSLSRRVPLLISKYPLLRMQAANALRADLSVGVKEVLKFLPDGNISPQVKNAILEWLKTTEVSTLDSELQIWLRTCLAGLLNNSDPAIRRNVAEIFQLFGPDEQRTRFLLSITDVDKRVRWAVVGYFGHHTSEVNRTQRLILVGFLSAGERGEFDQLDTDNDGNITRREWKTDEAAFSQFDKNSDGDITFEQWINPYPDVIRADVYALLLRLHEVHSAGEKPCGYNPYADATDQLKAVQTWRTWGQSVEDSPND